MKKYKEYTNTEICRIIDDVIHNAKYRDILKDRFVDGLTYEAIAEMRDLSAVHVKTIIYRHEGKIFDKL